MADDLKQRQPQDRKRINLNESWEVEYWCRKFKVEPEELRAAVKASGSSVNAVRKHFQSASGS
jgi:hypothetical protein